MRESLLGQSRDNLLRIFAELGLPNFRAEQLYRGIYVQRVEDFSGLTSLPADLRTTLAERYTLERPRIDLVQTDPDGTRKYRFVAADQAAFEAVYIPDVAHGRKTNTLCISSQTGCSVGCKFCFTATLRHHRDLAVGEIVGQVMACSADVGKLSPAARITNVVFMGMGEPLLNYDNVVSAARILIDPNALGLSSRRVTISTSGIVPRIYELGRDLPTQLAVSLNATTDEIRSQIMPINKKWPLETLLTALRAYPLPPRRRITIEYVLIKDVNDSPDDARRLAKILAGIPVKINLLGLNAHEGTALLPPEPERIDEFQQILFAAGYNALRRTPRGRQISAACGQLGDRTA